MRRTISWWKRAQVLVSCVMLTSFQRNPPGLMQTRACSKRRWQPTRRRINLRDVQSQRPRAQQAFLTRAALCAYQAPVSVHLPSSTPSAGAPGSRHAMSHELARARPFRAVLSGSERCGAVRQQFSSDQAEDSCNNLQSPAIICNHVQTRANTCKHMQPPAIIHLPGNPHSEQELACNHLRSFTPARYPAS